MEQWESRLAAHPAIEKLASLESALEAAAENLGEARDQASEVERMRHIVRRTAERIRRADSALTLASTLDAMSAACDGASAQLAQWETVKDVAQLVQVTPKVEALVPLLQSIPLGEQGIESKRIHDGMRQAGRRIEDELKGALLNIGDLRSQASKTIDELVLQARESLKSVQTQIQDAGKANADAAAKELAGAKAMVHGLEAQVAEVDRQAKQAQEANQNVLTNLQTAFSASQEKRLEEANANAAKISQEFELMRKSEETRRQETTQLVIAKAEATITILENIRVHATRLGDAAARAAWSEEFDHAAKEAGKSAGKYRSIGLGALGLGAAFFVVTLFASRITGEQFVGWDLILYRLSGAALFGACATVAFWIASGFNRKHFVYKTMQLQLAAISPYLADLDIPRQQAIKEALAYPFFTPPDLAEEARHQGKAPSLKFDGSSALPIEAKSPKG